MIFFIRKYFISKDFNIKNIINKKRLLLASAVIVFTFFIAIIPSYFVNAKQKNGIRCHKCKATDLNLIFKHKKIGYDGCFTCHKDQLKEYESKKKKEGKKK
jgi:hypothetical protein